MSSSISLRNYVENLSQSNLMTAEEIAEFESSLSADEQPKDGRDMARELVKRGRLTKYQALAVYRGMVSGLILGDYELLERIGEGGMGQVFKARHRRMDRMVALKVLPTKAMSSPDAVQRFQRETRAAAKLVHPNIVTAYDASEFKGIHYLVMEYIDGHDLASIVKDHGPMAIDLAVGCILQAATGLEYAHRQGVIHRDIKPANLLLASDSDGSEADTGSGSVATATVKILDMGLARVSSSLEKKDEESEQLTAAGQVMGTCDYMAPEQAADTHTADHRADIYSLGCTLYRLLTGKAVYRGDSLMQVLIAHQQSPIPALKEQRPDVPPALDDVFQKMVAKAPEERYQSMTEVIDALRACLQPSAASSGGRDERSTDVALQAFLQNVPKETSKSTDDSISGFEETIDLHAEQSTTPEAPEQASVVIHRNRTKLLGIGGGIVASLVVVVLAVVIAMRGGEAESEGPEQVVEAQPSVDATEASPPQEPASTAPGGSVTLVWPLHLRAEGRLEIDGHEPTADEYGEDGDFFVNLTLERGQHTIWIARRGYEPFTHTFDLQGEELRISPTWVAIAADEPNTEPETIADEVAVASDVTGVEETTDVEASGSDAPESEATAGEGAAPPTAMEQPASTPSVTPAVDAAELARLALLEEQRARDVRFAEAMSPVDQHVAAWDFAAAWQAAGALTFEEAELTGRLETRRDEIRRMEILKRRIIAAISAADPPLRKSDLAIRGINGNIVDAGPAGITSRSMTGDDERLKWSELGSQAAARLMKLVVQQGNGEDLIAAGLLSFAAGDREAAERFYQQAAATGADVSAQRTTMAADMLADANELLTDHDYSGAHALLKKIEQRSADLPWFATNRAVYDAAVATARKGIREAEAEALYATAVEQHDAGSLFDLRETIEQLKANYADCLPVTDGTRTPSVRDFDEAVAELGTRLTVRQDGKGDYTSIQAAINAAKPNSLIEIWDNGPYNESLLISEDQDGLVIRGAAACFPVIASAGAASNCTTLVGVSCDKVSLNRLALLHLVPSGDMPACLSLRDAGYSTANLLNVVLYIPYGSCVFGGQNQSSDFKLSKCLIIGDVRPSNSAKVHFTSCLTLKSVDRPYRVIASTLLQFSGSDPRSEIHDSIIAKGTISTPCNITYSNLSEGADRNFVISGEGCINAPPLFVNPAGLDYRLVPGSPGTGAASDGGDMGCRYTPEMIEMCQIALELRARGMIKF